MIFTSTDSKKEGSGISILPFPKKNILIISGSVMTKYQFIFYC